MRTLLKSERGNAIIEFALSWAVLSVIFTAMFEYGYTIWTYSALEDAVQNAAKTAASMEYDASTPTNFTTAVQNLVVYGSVTAGTTPVTTGLTTSNVSVDTHNVSGFPSNVTVSIQNYTVNAIFGSRTLNKPRVTVRFIGTVRP